MQLSKSILLAVPLASKSHPLAQGTIAELVSWYSTSFATPARRHHRGATEMSLFCVPINSHPPLLCRHLHWLFQTTSPPSALFCFESSARLQFFFIATWRAVSSMAWASGPQLQVGGSLPSGQRRKMRWRCWCRRSDGHDSRQYHHAQLDSLE